LSNSNLHNAKVAKNDEFYTQYEDIENEMNAYLEYDPDLFRDKTILCPCDDPEFSNFTRYFAAKFEMLGIKKLISTSYARNSKNYGSGTQVSLFELNSPQYDENKTDTHGKIFILDRDTDDSGHIDIDDLRWEYLEGDGDFRSDEVSVLRDECDFIITNPPFSLFREVIAWIVEGGKQFAFIGSMNAITYKEIFPLIKNNIIWLGVTAPKEFIQPDKEIKKFGNIYWFTNIEHGRRHRPMMLMNTKDNIKYSRHKEIRGIGYQHYDNYDAIEVPYCDAIPSDYDGVMGVPISWLDKYCPEQFEIIGLDRYTIPKEFLVGGRAAIKGKPTYARILIRYTDSWKKQHPQEFPEYARAGGGEDNEEK